MTAPAQAVARGNLKVFAEIGREFARFYADCLHDTAYDPEKIERFCDGLRPGRPAGRAAVSAPGVPALTTRRFSSTEAKARVELMLLANLEIGLHEQTRLQPEINEALDAPVVDPKQLCAGLLKELTRAAAGSIDVTWYVTGWLGALD